MLCDRALGLVQSLSSPVDSIASPVSFMAITPSFEDQGLKVTDAERIMRDVDFPRAETRGKMPVEFVLAEIE